MITNNVIQRVFYLKYGGSTGTCFTVDIDGKQYFITAKHVIDGLPDNGNIELLHDKKWNQYKIRLVGHSSTADVSVFTLPGGPINIAL